MKQTFELPSRPDAIAPALEAIQRGLTDVGVVHELALELRLVVEELVTNVVKYAEAVAIEVELEVSEESILLEVRDNGRHFDPLGASAPDLDANVEDRSLGGLGIHLVRSLADDVRYQRVDSWNVLRLIKSR